MVSMIFYYSVSDFDSSEYRTVFHFATVFILNELELREGSSVFGSCIYGFFLALVETCICGYTLNDEIPKFCAILR